MKHIEIACLNFDIATVKRKGDNRMEVSLNSINIVHSFNDASYSIFSTTYVLPAMKFAEKVPKLNLSLRWCITSLPFNHKLRKICRWVSDFINVLSPSPYLSSSFKLTLLSDLINNFRINVVAYSFAISHSNEFYNYLISRSFSQKMIILEHKWPLGSFSILRSVIFW